jgi:hypothetical protein
MAAFFMPKTREEECFVSRKPKVRLTGQDGNVFNLIGICSRALKKAGRLEEARAMQERVFSCGSYEEALVIMGEYVEIR